MHARRVIAFAAAVALVLSGCDLKHTNDPDAFAIHFKNDLSQPVVLALCPSGASTDCANPPYSDHVAVNGVDVENISPDVSTEWAVESTDGQLLRCVRLYWKYWPGHDEIVKLSEAPVWAAPCARKTPAIPYLPI